MVLTAGIVPDEALQTALNDTSAITNKLRALRVDINEDFTHLVLGATAPSGGNVDSIELDSLLPQVLLPESPQFILYQRDDHSWLLINYIPETAKVKSKMLHASSVRSLKEAFGENRVSHEINITLEKELKWAYIHKQHFDINPEELKSSHEKIKDQAIRDEEEARQAQILAHNERRGQNPLMGSGSSSGGGVSFPFSDEASGSIMQYNSGVLNYCRYKLDIKTEVVQLEQASTCAPDDLRDNIPTTCATFNLYRYIHNEQAHNIFAMCMPSGVSLSIKERMLNASCKNGIVATLGSHGVEINQNMEIDGGDELSETNLKNRVAPDNSASTGFVKKARPVGRRPQKNMGVKVVL